MIYVLVCCCFVVLFCGLISVVYLPRFVGVVCFRFAFECLMRVVFVVVAVVRCWCLLVVLICLV